MPLVSALVTLVAIACVLLLAAGAILPPSNGAVSPLPWRAFLPLASLRYDGRATSTWTPTPTFTPTPTPTATSTPTPTPTATDEEPVPSLLVQPYLGETTTTSVVISWATEDSGGSEVHCGLDTGLGTTVPASSHVYDGKHWHTATITGLAAGTRYHYRVYTSGHDLTPWPDVTFTTAPAASAQAFTFAALGDGRPWKTSWLPSEGAVDVAAQLAKQDFDLALHVGDIVNNGGVCSGSDSGWNQYIRAYFQLYQDSTGRAPFYPSVGNHELNGGTCGYQSYTDVYSLPENAPAGAVEEYYSFDWAHAHFVALDTSQDYSAGSTQYEWLVADLESSDKAWTFVSLHYPAYSSGSHGSTEQVLTHLVPVFEKQGVDAVFAGHDHHYERTCPVKEGACTTVEAGGVVHWVTGGGGAPLYEVSGDWFTQAGESIYQFMLVEVHDCWLLAEAIDTEGKVFDSYRLDRCAEGTGQ